MTRDHLVAARDIELSAIRAENGALRGEIENLASSCRVATSEDDRDIRVVREQLLSALAAARELQRTVHCASGQSASAADLIDVDCSLMGEKGLLRVIEVMREVEDHVRDRWAQHDRLQVELVRRSKRRSSAREIDLTGKTGSTQS